MAVLIGYTFQLQEMPSTEDRSEVKCGIIEFYILALLKEILKSIDFKIEISYL